MQIFYLKPLHFNIKGVKIEKNSMEGNPCIMAKKLLAVILSICVLCSLACVASAASLSIDSDIAITLRICPGDSIDETKIAAPSKSGPVFSEGWEIRLAGSEEWIPYYGGPIDEEYNAASIRYFVASYGGDYEYSNECLLTVAHNPKGSYKWDGSNHWRECADCGEKADVAYHSFFSTPETNDVTICSVCGAEKTAQYRGLAAFWTWLMNLIMSLLG